jgi:hypothetical protein
MAQLMDRATDLYIESLAESATDQVGRIARDASSDLCSLEIEGPANVILRFVSSANRFLEAMLELQEIALVTSPDTCHFEISGS